VTAPPHRKRRLDASPLGLLRRYDLSTLRADATAGLTVALFTIPQAMAYALIAGFPPSVGIATAVVASILGAVFGSSEFLVNGPTNAIVVMLAASAGLFAAHGDPLAMMILLTVTIGVLQTLGAFLRVGSIVRYVSEPVLTGFTSGAGLYIVINQLPSVLGLPKSTLAEDLGGWVPPHDALFDLLRTLVSASHGNAVALGIAVATLVIVRVVQRLEGRLHTKLPGPFLAIATVTAVAWAFDLGAPGPNRIMLVQDIEPLTRSLPTFSMPTGTLEQVVAVLPVAVAVGVLGAVEAIAIGKVLAARAEHPFDASRQLLGEGVCNIGAAFVGGFASSGSFTRTAVIFDAGARTRVSVILSGVFVMALVLLAAPLANQIPIAALAGTLVHIGIKLVDVGRIQAAVNTTRADRAVLWVTFLGVLLLPHLEWALLAGVVLSAGLALRRAGRFRLMVIGEREDGELVERPDVTPAEVGDVALLNLKGEMFFAAAEDLERRLRDMLDDNTRFLVVRVIEAYNLDATMADVFATVARDARARGGALILCGVSKGMEATLRRAGVTETIGEDNIFPHEGALLGSTRKALARAHALAEEAPIAAG
jgi:SulP family sulfate permease